MSEIEGRTKPYIEWTPADHYRAAALLLSGISALADQAAPSRNAEVVLETLMQRAQLHATLACVDPRIATMAREKYHQDNPEEESD